jgi:hypothetical protein
MKRLAIIAHDNKKVDLVAWATFNRETLVRFALTATRHTARLLERKIGPPVEELLSGPEGITRRISAVAVCCSCASTSRFTAPASRCSASARCSSRSRTLASSFLGNLSKSAASWDRSATPVCRPLYFVA